ncbi:MAG TPA: dihydroorotase, partial [Gammaproteobacteria bacterium]|nr:dihydroorotase [Gammaproteobacteria bacterium]
YLYFGANKNHLNEVSQVADEVIGLKIFMGSSTGDLLMADDESLHQAFSIAAGNNLLVAVHAEDECLIQRRTKKLTQQADFRMHSYIRDSEVAAKAVEKAIALAKHYQTRLYILHVSCADELDLIAAAKQQGLPVYAETTPHHLFLSTTAYENLGGKVQMNPPLRTEAQRLKLWEYIANGTIDTIGSDHAPHTVAEKTATYGQVPSGVPGIETTLPLLLNAYHSGMITLKQIVALTHDRAQEIFALPNTNDYVLVDLSLEKTVVNENLATKCQWSPFAGMRLKGWPVHTILSAGNKEAYLFDW